MATEWLQRKAIGCHDDACDAAAAAAPASAAVDGVPSADSNESTPSGSDDAGKTGSCDLKKLIAGESYISWCSEMKVRRAFLC